MKNADDKTMKRRLQKGTAAFLTAGALLLFTGGCSVRNVTPGMGVGEAYDAVISVKGKDAPADASGAYEEEETIRDTKDLESLRALLGKTDEEAAGLLGGGEENRTADGSLLIGRNYTAAFFGEECRIYTSYDENGAVFMALVQLPGEDAQKWQARLDAVTGKQAAFSETEEEGKRFQWQYEGCLVTLYEAEGAVSLDIMAE